MIEEKRLISFIIYSERGFFKKPDINDTIYLTYNIIHKPAVLGILGAIVGLKGFEKSNTFPEYYNKLKNIPVGIKPIGDEKGSFPKIAITYNNTTGFASKEKGGNLIINEQTLLKPAYKIYLLLNLLKKYQKKLYENIKKQQAEYLPYMGKNDYSLWWYKNEVEEYKYEKLHHEKEFSIDTIFIKNEPVWKCVVEAIGRRALAEQQNWFCSFERLPIRYNEELLQYELASFAYTNAKLKKDIKIKSGNLYYLKEINKAVFLY